MDYQERAAWLGWAVVTLDALYGIASKESAIAWRNYCEAFPVELIDIVS